MAVVMRCACSLLLLALLAPTPATGDVGARFEDARAQLVRDLEVVAKWCQGQKLFGRRDEIYEQILELDADHELARRKLKFKRGEDGTWTQNPKYKRPKNFKTSMLGKADERFEQAQAKHRRALLEASDAAGERSELEAALEVLRRLIDERPKDEAIQRSLRRALMAHARAAEAEDRFDLAGPSKQELTRRFPDDPEVLPETAAAWKRRDQLAGLAKQALATAEKPQADELTATESAVEVPWTGAFKTQHVRVVGTSPADSLKAIARACEAAAPFFEKVMGHPARRNPVFTFVVFEKKDHWDAYLSTYAGISAEERKAAEAAELSGWSFADGRYGIRYVQGPAFELDLAVDVIFQHFLFHTFSEWQPVTRSWKPLRAWVNVGVSDYLTFRLIGTRLLTTVGGSYDASAKDFKDRVPDLQRAWLAGARKVLERERVPGTHMLLGKYLGAFTKDDALAAYGLASYVLESHVDRIYPLLSSVGQNRPPEESFGKVLQLTISDLHTRLVRWLEEMNQAR